MGEVPLVRVWLSPLEAHPSWLSPKSLLLLLLLLNPRPASGDHARSTHPPCDNAGGGLCGSGTGEVPDGALWNLVGRGRCLICYPRGRGGRTKGIIVLGRGEDGGARRRGLGGRGGEGRRVKRIAKEVRMMGENICSIYGGGAPCTKVCAHVIFAACDCVVSSSLRSSSDISLVVRVWCLIANISCRFSPFQIH